MRNKLSLILTGTLLLGIAVAGFIYQNAPGVPNSAIPTPTALAEPEYLSSVPALDTVPQQPKWAANAVPTRALNYPSVGKVTLYGNMTNPAELVLFISGDGGWNLGVVDMAKTLAQDGQTLVVGIDIIKYYKILEATSEKCLYPAGDMENLSEFVQKALKLPSYHKPILVGYSSGATLTYALLCQAPAGTFRGGIALGFCPDIVVNKPLCEGSGKLTMTRRKDGKGFDFTDQPAPAAPLELLHGDLDQDCICQNTLDFFKNVAHVRVVRLPKVGHGYSVTKNWLPQFKQAFSHIIGTTDADSGQMLQTTPNHIPVAMADVDSSHGAESNATDLPLNITQAPPDANTPMMVFISGDGGWTGFDQQVCNELAAKHIPTVGLNSQSYFWKKKTPEQTIADLVPVIRQYLQTWGKSKFILAGYSFGANVVPFLHNRLPADLREKVVYMVMLSADTRGDFEIHVAGMLGQSGGPYDVAAEVRSLQHVPVILVSGESEGSGMENALQGAAHLRFEKIPGSHHYNNDAPRVASAIYSAR